MFPNAFQNLIEVLAPLPRNNDLDIKGFSIIFRGFSDEMDLSKTET